LLYLCLISVINRVKGHNCLEMKFALIGNTKTIAYKGAKGICPNCGSEVIAKCGDLKQQHWAHKAISNCDPWWENETEWHRNWKNNFPIAWQEIIKYDSQTGEKHIADICTNEGLIVEFQHSHLDSIERLKRESFYKPMIWIVDGTRLKRDYLRFLSASEYFHRTNMRGVFHVISPDKVFPKDWLKSKVPVIFDYKGSLPLNDPKDTRRYLYCMLPQIKQNEVTIGVLTREFCINDILKGGKWFHLKD